MINLYYFLLILLSPIWAAIFHATLSRVSPFRKAPPQRNAILSCALTCFLFTLSSAWLEWDFAITGLSAFTLCFTLLLCHLYFHVFNMSETARRIRILLEVHDGKTPTASLAGLNSQIQIRVQRLVALKQMENKGELFFVKKRILYFAAIIVLWKELVLFPHRKHPA